MLIPALVGGGAALADPDGPCACANASFGPAPESFLAGLSTNAAAVEDFTSDGIADAVVANHLFTGALSLLPGTGTGRFGPPLSIPSGAEGGSDLATADFNRDGKPDVAVVGMFGGLLAVLLGDGQGGFAAPWTFFVGIQAVSVVAADFNGDGWPDLAVACRSSVDTAVLLNHGDGSFEPPTPAFMDYYQSRLRTADWNEDGIPDLAVSHEFSLEIWLRPGIGDGTFGPLTVIDAGAVPSDWSTADMDEDGHLDLVVGDGSAARVLVVRGDGSGSFGAPVAFAAGEAVISLVVGDADEDGHVDAVVSHGFPDSLTFLKGTGGGALQAPAAFAPGVGGRLVLADLDADGHADLLGAARSHQSVVVLRGAGDGSFDAPPRFGTGAGPVAQALGDFNEDGWSDLAVGGTGAVSILLGDGLGGMSLASSYPVTGLPNSIAVAYLNADAHADLAVNGNGSDTISLLFGNGNGGFTPGPSLSAGLNLTSVASADFNEDTIADLVTTDSVSPGAAVFMFLGNGDGSFGAPTAIPVGDGAPQDILAFDLNLDGHVDLAIPQLFGDVVEVRLGSGTGTFSPSAYYPTSILPGAVAAGDFNEDGAPDLAVGSEWGSLLLGTGTGAFLPPVSLGLPNAPNSIVASDLNGDGHIDVAATDSTINRTAVRFGGGDGTFLPAVAFVLGGRTAGLVAADVDEDSRPDLLVTSLDTDDVALLRNTGCTVRRLRLVSDVGGPASTGLPFPGQPSLDVRDDGDNLVACAAGDVVAGLEPGSGTSGAALLGDASATLLQGVASFTDLAVDRAGGDYRLQFNHPGAHSKLSSPFDVSPPSLAIADASVTEGDSGTAAAVFSVTLSGPSGLPVSVSYATAPGTAQAGIDFQPAAGTLSLAPGATQQSLAVQVIGDTIPEPAEHFTVSIQAPSNAVLTGSLGRGLILDDDGGTFSVSEASHGLEQVLALAPGAAPQHLYLLSQRSRSSYEAGLDGASADLGAGAGPSLRRIGPDLFTVLQDSVPAGAGAARRLAWEHTAAAPEEGEYLEVRSLGCTSGCDPADVYRLRLLETTGFIPRFNNGGGQVTVLVLQNLGSPAVSGHAWFWGSSGTLLGSVAVSVPGRGQVTISTPSVPGVAGEAGTLTVSHDAGYGMLAGKAVALEPGTGFTFDTAMVVRPH